MSTIQKSPPARRPRTALRLLAMLVAGGVFLGLAAQDAFPKRGASNVINTSSDSTLLYGPTRIYGDIVFNWTDDEFTADSVIGKRYVIEFKNGSGVTAIQAVVDSQQWVGESEGVTLKRAIDIGTTGTHSLMFFVKGTATSWMDCRMISDN